MARNKRVPCKRPYTLGKRREFSDHKRTRILAAARAQLESDGFLNLTLEGLARKSGVTRQTIYNLFGTRTGLFEALFDQVASAGGMHHMREVMQQSDPALLLPAFVQVFTNFWSRDRLFLRRIHGIAAIDPELGAAVQARNQRRQMAATRVVERVPVRGPSGPDEDASAKLRRTAALYALTSFEFFDALAETTGTAEAAAGLVLDLVKREFQV